MNKLRTILSALVCAVVLVFIGLYTIPYKYVDYLPTRSGYERALQGREQYELSMSFDQVQPQFPLPPPGVPTVLILSPMKDSLKYLDILFENLRELEHSHAAISIAFLHSGGDGELEPNSTTWQRLLEELPSLRSEFRRVQLFHKDYVVPVAAQDRHHIGVQLYRRSVLAKARNYLLSRALDDEEYVLWIDVDLQEFPANIIQTFLKTQKDIIVPNVVMEAKGQSYDLNTWKRGNHTRLEVIMPGTFVMGKNDMLDLSMKMIVEECGRALQMSDRNIWKVQSVLAAAGVGTVSALIGLKQKQYGELELPSAMKNCMGPLLRQPYDKTVRIYPTSVDTGDAVLTCREDWNSDLMMEGYGRTGNLYLHKLRHLGDVVEIDSVGGAMLFIRADLHREGLVFPSYPYRGRIETEGLAAMAIDMGYRIYGMPFLEVMHP